MRAGRAHERDLAATARYFAAQLQKHKAGARALDWPRRKSQELRFQALAEIGRLDGCTVLDVGCGLGDFAAWLARQGITVRYTGVDICAEMVAAARARFPSLDFQCLDILRSRVPVHDWVFASGIFYLRRHAPYEFLRDMAGRMAGLARRGVSFNCLARVEGKAEPGEFRADPFRAAALVRPLAPRMILRMDYHPSDFTIHLLKKPFPSK
ncbi:MAG: class I SAM-dependent methyltransferase [Terrimicrobiaceae bacterium]|nr:class I SAM-dependent methyltransferase [Terrimicrobiaceae bacterium]